MNSLPVDTSAAAAKSNARLEPNRWTRAAADIPASPATSASVSFWGPTRSIARRVATRMSLSDTRRGRGLISADYKWTFSFSLISKPLLTYRRGRRSGDAATMVFGGDESRWVYRRPSRRVRLDSNGSGHRLCRDLRQVRHGPDGAALFRGDARWRADARGTARSHEDHR